MIRWAIIVFVISLIAGLLGFTDVLARRENDAAIAV